MLDSPEKFYLSSSFMKIAYLKKNRLSVYQFSPGFYKITNFEIAKNEGYLFILNKDDKTLFLNKLNKLRKKSLCEACGKLCPGIYTEDDNSFKLEDTKLALEMMKLNGNVLDIGFGEFYFSKVIVNELGEKVHYTGIEPDEEKYAIIRKSYPGLELYNTSFEDFEYPDRSFDFILMIGTYNHIKDIRKCLRKCRLLLKTGGRLLIAETSLFILGVEPSKNSSFSRVPSD